MDKRERVIKKVMSWIEKGYSSRRVGELVYDEIVKKEEEDEQS